MQDRNQTARRKPLATHGRTTHRVIRDISEVLPALPVYPDMSLHRSEMARGLTFVASAAAVAPAAWRSLPPKAVCDV